MSRLAASGCRAPATREVGGEPGWQSLRLPRPSARAARRSALAAVRQPVSQGRQQQQEKSPGARAAGAKANHGHPCDTAH